MQATAYTTYQQKKKIVNIYLLVVAKIFTSVAWCAGYRAGETPE